MASEKTKKSTHIRVWIETKRKLITLQRKFTVENDGEPVSMMETLARIVDQFDIEKQK